MSEPVTAQDTSKISIGPKVSIGMPVYNGGKTLAEAIRSVIAQSVPEIEIIISDNGSQDDTAEVCKAIIAADPRIRYFRQPETICATENFKFVLDKARAPYFMWAAHDDVRDPDYAERLMAALEANPRAILAFGDVIRTENGVTAPMPLETAPWMTSPTVPRPSDSTTSRPDSTLTSIITTMKAISTRK